MGRKIYFIAIVKTNDTRLLRCINEILYVVLGRSICERLPAALAQLIISPWQQLVDPIDLVICDAG